jgi:hypothetical protein
MTDNLQHIALDGIRRHAEWLILSSREIGHYVALLKAQPNFETEAADAMARAAEALDVASDNLEIERYKFQILLVED